MGQATSLPLWANVLWMSLSWATLTGAAIWTLCIFWPILREGRRMQIEALRLGRVSTDALADLQRELKSVVADVKRVTERTERLLDRMEREDTFKRVEAHIAAIRSRIERDTNPLPIRTRPELVGKDGNGT